MFLKPVFKIISGIFLLLLIGASGYFLLRPWTMRWGATDEEVHMALPGDPDIPPNSEVSTRAITIHAPASSIWPWLDQIGQERGGFYSYTYLENIAGAGMRNTEELLPSAQHLKIGDRVSYFQGGPPGTYGRVTLIQPERALALSGWSFYLKPVDEQTTRLIVRYPFQLGHSPGETLFYYGFFEEAHFIMESGMMMGLKQRAEMSAIRQ